VLENENSLGNQKKKSKSQGSRPDRKNRSPQKGNNGPKATEARGGEPKNPQTSQNYSRLRPQSEIPKHRKTCPRSERNQNQGDYDRRQGDLPEKLRGERGGPSDETETPTPWKKPEGKKRKKETGAKRGENVSGSPKRHQNNALHKKKRGRGPEHRAIVLARCEGGKRAPKAKKASYVPGRTDEGRPGVQEQKTEEQKKKKRHGDWPRSQRGGKGEREGEVPAKGLGGGGGLPEQGSFPHDRR